MSAAGLFCPQWTTRKHPVRKSNLSIRGQVRMVLPYLFGRCTLLPALPLFFQRYPDVDLQLNFSDGAII